MAKIRLVFADKEGGFREGLARLLENEPTVELVCICGTGLEAVDSAYKHRPDVVLIDLRLSECSSVEAIQRIHEGLPKTNIIVLTHPEADDDLVSAARAGAKAYISKDISIETLVKAITLVADGGVVISAPMATRLLAEFGSLEENKDAEKLYALLSKREQTVLSLVAQGSTNREIADALLICENTVKVHLRNIMEKLHARTRQQAVSLVRKGTQLFKSAETDVVQA